MLMFCLLQPLWRGGGGGVGGDSDITHHFQQHGNIFLAVLANLCVLLWWAERRTGPGQSGLIVFKLWRAGPAKPVRPVSPSQGQSDLADRASGRQWELWRDRAGRGTTGNHREPLVVITLSVQLGGSRGGHQSTSVTVTHCDTAIITTAASDGLAGLLYWQIFSRVNPFHDGSIIQCYCGYDSYISYFLLLISPLYYISFTEYRKDYLKMWPQLCDH